MEEEGEAKEDDTEDAQGEVWYVAVGSLVRGLGGEKRRVEEEKGNGRPVDYHSGIVGTVRIGKVGIDETGA